ncbi:musculin-like [Oncorhynchus tshawytscha]|uniref:BHLH domain-containing protein n=1 Tax=Oncorhynchus tshawytscha TaxID=74940 RepID=A0A8C8J101_ONCTS|nr:musculin-like [Oncorhynchus tshawytscha]
MSTGSVSDGEDIETRHGRTDAPFESYKTKRNVAQRRYTSTDAFVGTDGGYEVRTKRSYSTAVGGKQLFKGGRQKDGRQMQRNAANARERARMRVLSKAFSRLKTSLPWVPADTKLSKLDTLRLASSYISHLRQLLQENHFESSFVHPVNLTWPFVVGRSEDNKDMSAAGLCGVIS